MARRSATAGLLALALFSCPSVARAQAVSNPNQIVGELAFTNESPDVLAILGPPGNRGFSRAMVYGTSVGLGTRLEHSTTAEIDWLLHAGYELTVESGVPGIEYSLRPDVGLTRGAYTFALGRSGPVEPEPTPDQRVDLLECAGILRVRFLDALGNPVPLETGELFTPGRGWSADVNSGETVGLLVLRGSEDPQRVVIAYTTGADPLHDTVRYEVERDVVVRCDEIVDLGVACTGASAPGDPSGLGRIAGEIDILGVDEVPQFDPALLYACTTQVRVIQGPFGNERYDCLNTFPSSGPWELENLVPSDVESPPAPYRLQTRAVYGDGVRRGGVTWPDEYLMVEADETLDLADRFVMDPGTVRASVTLAGPPASPERGDAVLEDVTNDTFAHVSLSVVGTTALAPGATESARGIRGGAGGVATYDDSTATLDVDVELVTGGFQREGGVHAPDSLYVHWHDTSTPEDPDSYHAGSVDIHDERWTPFVLEPGDEVVLEAEYCVSHVTVGFRTLAGTFFRPEVTHCDGGFLGVDFRGELAAYQVHVGQCIGTPIRSEDASDRGQVVLALPQGTYLLEPFVQAVDPGGGTSWTQVPPFEVEVGCRQVIDVLPDLVVILAQAPPCAADFLTVEGRVEGDRPIATLAYSVNGGPAVDICRDCGVDPTFSVLVPVPEGDASVTVSAVDEAGADASTTTFTRWAREPSAPDLRPAAEPLRVRKAGRSALTLTWEDLGGAGANVYQGTIAALQRSGDYDHASAGACGLEGARADLPAPPQDAYFLVGGACEWGDGSLGRSSRGRERDEAAPRCP